MKKGKLYGVGVGPGDKELITIKAIRILRECDVIAVPKTKNGDTTAYNIIKEYVENKKILECNMPMTKDITILNNNYENIANMLEKELLAGENIAFVTLGDPTIYSTYMQINAIIGKRGYETQIISGVTSFCAAAARLNISLCERDEFLTVIPTNYMDFEANINLKGTRVYMKSNKAINQLKNYLYQTNKNENIYAIECCGLEKEKIYKSIEALDEKSGYFSIVIVKENDND